MEEPVSRCPWSLATPQYRAYHDEEWGRPCHDERRLFEMLLLEGAQAGLSWRTILERRDGYRQVFDGFDAKLIAGYSDAELAVRLTDPRIVRNRLKVFGFRRNAQAYLALCESEGSLDRWLWQWVEGRPVLNEWRDYLEVPVTTPLSDVISKGLKERGFTFVGSTIIYAYLQAVGIVNDHPQSCGWHVTSAA